MVASAAALPEPFPAFRSRLRADALIEHVLSHYDLGGAPACALFAYGINDVYLVCVGQQRWMLRISAANGSAPAHVQGEMTVLRHLDGAGVAVPVPVARRDGETLTLIHAPEGVRTAVLFPYVESVPGEAASPDRAARYGAALARMHLAADSLRGDPCRPRHDERYFVIEPLARVDGFAFAPFADSAEAAYLHEAAPALWEQAARLPQAPPQYGFCHGDVMAGNALYGADGTVTLIDFDYSGVGWRVYDLATYLWVLIVDGPALDWSRHEVFRALLQGYQSVRALSDAEIEALPVFAALRQVFLFGAGIKHAPYFGMAWMSGDWLARMCEFIRLCRDGHWLARVGLC